jgi:hypothetical protein
MEQDLIDICDALEEMMDAADDAWEAEQRGSVNRRDNIRKSRYLPARELFKRSLDSYIDSRIKMHYDSIKPKYEKNIFDEYDF